MSVTYTHTSACVKVLGTGQQWRQAADGSVQALGDMMITLNAAQCDDQTATNQLCMIKPKTACRSGQPQHLSPYGPLLHSRQSLAEVHAMFTNQHTCMLGPASAHWQGPLASLASTHMGSRIAAYHSKPPHTAMHEIAADEGRLGRMMGTEHKGARPPAE